MADKHRHAGSRRPDTQDRPGDVHRTKPRTLSDQARERLASGEAAKPGGDAPEEPRTAAVQGKNPKNKTHHD